MRHARRLIAAASIAVLAFTGCSAPTAANTEAAASGAAAVEVPTAQALWTQVSDLMKSAESVHMSGTAWNDSKEVTLDIAGNRAGTNQKMKLKIEDGGQAEVITVDGISYIKADKAFWASNGTSITDPAVLKKYISQGKNSEAPMSIGSMFDEMAAGDFNLIDVVNLQVGQTTLDGKPAFEITERVASQYKPHVWTSADGKGTLLKLEVTDENGKVTSLSFEDWNNVAKVKAPPKSQVLEA